MLKGRANVVLVCSVYLLPVAHDSYGRWKWKRSYKKRYEATEEGAQGWPTKLSLAKGCCQNPAGIRGGIRAARGEVYNELGKAPPTVKAITRRALP